MYGWIWRHLPGPMSTRLLVSALIVIAVIAVLFLWGFTYLAPYVPFNDGTVSQ